MFNKHFPERREAAPKGMQPLDRAILLRMATYVSTAMLIVGYAMIWILWE